MADRLLRQPALAPDRLRPRGVRLAERTGLGKIDLRGDPSDRTFMTGIGRVLDLLLPTEPNTSATKGSITALWQGPDQWLLTCPADDVAFFINTLRQALAGSHTALTEVTDGRIALSLAGPSARDLLAKGCPLDLHPRSFKPGQCAQSLLAKASILLQLRADDPEAGPTFDLYIARSFAPYLWSWLEDAGLEYGVQVEPERLPSSPADIYV
jgi:sarcosine oxidase, subunit gamma